MQRDKDTQCYAFSTTTKEGSVGPALVFCNSIAAVKRVSETLRVLGLPALPLHAQMAQKSRFESLASLRRPNSLVPLWSLPMWLPVVWIYLLYRQSYTMIRLVGLIRLFIGQVERLVVSMVTLPLEQVYLSSPPRGDPPCQDLRGVSSIIYIRTEDKEVWTWMAG